MRKTVTFATWNIGSLYAGHPLTHTFLKELLVRESPDILCLQELPERPDLWENIAGWGGYAHRLYQVTSPSHVDKGHNMGIGVFSRYPLSLLHVLPLNIPVVPVTYQGKPEVWHPKYFLTVAWGAPVTAGRFSPDSGKPVLSPTSIGEESKLRPAMEAIEKEGRKEPAGLREDGSPSPGGLLFTGHGFPFHRYGLENEAGYPIIASAFAPLDQRMEELLREAEDLPLLAAADFNIAAPLCFLPRCGKSWIDPAAGLSTRPSGRKTDAILFPRVQGLPTNAPKDTPAKETSPYETTADGSLIDGAPADSVSPTAASSPYAEPPTVRIFPTLASDGTPIFDHFCLLLRCVFR